MNGSDLIGFLGVFQILLAYFLNVTGRLKTNTLPFIMLNLLGAGMACLASAMIGYWPFIILEGIWALVSFIGLISHINNS